MTHTGTPRRKRPTLPRVLLWTSGLLLVGAALLQPRQAARHPVPKAHSVQKPAAHSARRSAPLQAQYARLPLSFEANQGQFARPVRFLARGKGYSLALTAREAVLSLQPHTPVQEAGTTSRIVRPAHGRSRHTLQSSAAPVSVRLRLLNANPEPTARPEQPLPGTVNYLFGSDPKQWRTGVATYGKVRYRQVYPGIDVTYYGNQRQLEYDFEVAPGADPERIRFGIRGARRMEVNRRGELVLRTPGGNLVQHAPVIYQEREGRREKVDGGYVLLADAREVGFQVGAYDTGRPLVIDPVLSYSTYLGGSGGEAAGAIAVDSQGSAYVVGATSSGNFPTQNALQPGSRGNGDVFITKLDPTGTSRVYSTYLGGGAQDYGIGVAVDGAGSAYVVGLTNSVDFPTRNPLQGANGGGFDTFVAKLTPAGTGLVYSTYLGGDYPDDHPGGIAVTGAGEACIVGWTAGTNFPTRNPLQGTAGDLDAYVAKLNAAGTGFIFSTFLGGSNRDLGRAVAVDPAGNVYATGVTSSTDFPTPNGFQRTIGLDQRDAFVAKLTPTGSALVYGTFLGGSRGEDGTAIAADGDGNAYAVGDTSSLDYPTQNPIQPVPTESGDVYITKLNPGGSALVYSTGLGGSEFDEAYGAAVDGAGNLFVCGDSSSPNFPVVDSLQAFGGVADAFVAQVNPAGSALVYNTFLGGTNYDFAIGVAVDPAGNAYALGTTSSNNFPTFNAVQPNSGGGSDAFMVKLKGSGGPPPPPATHFSLTAPATATAGAPFSVTLTALDAANNPVVGYTGTVHWTSSDAQAALPADYTFTAADGGTHTFNATLKTAGAQTLTATDTAKPALKGSAPVTVNAGAPVGLRFGQQPTNTSPGAAIAPPVTVRVVDAFGNTVTSANPTVSLALGVNPSGGTLNGTVSVAAVNGIATFNNVSVDKVGSGYTLAPSAAGLPGPFTESAPFNVTAKPATHFSVTAPASASSGSAFDVTVTALDADNKTATGYTGSVRWTSTDPQAVLPPDYTFTAGDAGVHHFTITLKTVGSKVITVTDKATASINGTATVIVTEPVSFVVTTAADTVQSADGVTSLREAILAANAHVGLDTITFKIPGSGLKTLAPISPLPTVTDPVVIDGYTQPGAKVNTAPSFATNAVLTVEISGAKAGKGVNGLTITAGGSTVRGLAINRFQAGADGTQGAGIALKSAGLNTVAGCFLGTSNTGTAAFGNVTGVLVDECPDNTIGGAPAAANLISGNGTGVDVEGDAAIHNTVRGNVMGTNAAGTATLKGATGVDLEGLDNQIGPGNLISGHTLVGVFVAAFVPGRVVTGNVIMGNRIGTDVSGTKSVANASGINLVNGATRTQVGGDTTGARNLISGNQSGVSIFESAILAGVEAPSKNAILGNYIGTDLSGAKALPNKSTGVAISGGAHDNVLGGDVPGARNVISGNGDKGVLITGGSTGNSVQGNYIGTNAAGTAVLSNSFAVFLDGASNNQIGGTTPGAGNVISGSASNSGITLLNGSNGNTVQGNRIGTNAAGTSALPNFDGFVITRSDNNTIGGTAAGARNLISGNTREGVNAGGTGNVFQGNYVGTTLSGAAALPNGTGFIIRDGGNAVGGAVPGAGNLISGNKVDGIRLLSASGVQLQGNLIGLNAGGSAALPNDVGVHIDGNSENNVIGGVAAGARNVISGNKSLGISVTTPDFKTNRIQGNYIGTNATGTAAVGNRTGVDLAAAGCVVGGTEPGAGNLVSGNTFGVVPFAKGSQTIQGNLIGTDASGMSAVPNQFGVVIDINANDNLIGGTLPGARNVISGNLQDGIRVPFVSKGNRIQGNYIGTNVLGTAPLPNLRNGISLEAFATNNLIGGDVPGAGNVISGNKLYAILMNANCGGNTVQGNYIGLDVTGNVRIANFDGLHIFSSNNLIGGVTPGAGNVISGSDATGVLLTDKAANNVVQGNRIGTNAAGTAAIPNINGIYHRTTSSNTVGGTNPLAGNLISGNEVGVKIVGSACVVQGNRIGTNADGTAAVPNTDSGCFIQGNSNTVGGTVPGAGNVLSGNGKNGVWIADGTSNMVQGNFAGANAAGTAALPNGAHGVYVNGQNNLIGGTTPGARNLLSGNRVSGAAITTVGAKEAAGNVVQGNYIGTDLTGTRSIPNQEGVEVSADACTIGGTAAGAGNLISGNELSGVTLRHFRTVVQGNFIGTDASGTAAVPNRYGVQAIGAANNSIGGVTAGAGNRIAMNTVAGVAVLQPSGGISIRGNAIYDNGGLGIDLRVSQMEVGGVTPNDPLDKDTGGNGFQNYPVLTQVTVSGGNVTVRGTLNSSAKKRFMLDFYRSTTPDPTGFGEGQVYVGSVTVTTDSAGNAGFSAPFPVGAAGAGQFFTATASLDLGGGFLETSEFSQAVQVPGP